VNPVAGDAVLALVLRQVFLDKSFKLQPRVRPGSFVLFIGDHLKALPA
jgi:hypothetical protein